MPSSLATQAFLDAFVEEGHIVGPLLQHVIEGELQKSFGQIRVIGEVGEGDLRLDHPELGEVAARVRVLGAERRPECVDLGQGETVGLDVESARHREKGFAAEEILGKVDRTLRRARQVREFKRRDAEQCAGPSASEEVMMGVLPGQIRSHRRSDGSHCERVTDTGRCADHIRPRAQVRDLAVAMLFLAVVAKLTSAVSPHLQKGGSWSTNSFPRP